MHIRLFGRMLARQLRFRLKTILIALAVISLPLALWAQLEARRARFLREAAYHRSRILAQVLVGVGSPGSYAILHSTPEGRSLSPAEAESSLWHLGLALKYEKAAERPWMPLEPDPPPPDGTKSGKVQFAHPGDLDA